MKLSGVSIIWEYAEKNFKWSLELVVVLDLESKGLYENHIETIRCLHCRLHVLFTDRYGFLSKRKGYWKYNIDGFQNERKKYIRLKTIQHLFGLKFIYYILFITYSAPFLCK